MWPPGEQNWGAAEDGKLTLGQEEFLRAGTVVCTFAHEVFSTTVCT